MRSFLVRLLPAAVFISILPAAAPAAASRPASEADSPEWVYVANVGSGPVTAYSALASGPVPRAFTIENPDLTNTYWAPWGVAFDSQGSLYVQTFLSSATTFVFAPGSSGHATPSRVFRGGGPDTRAIAVDSQGYEYIATGEGPAEIHVLPPFASGSEASSYTVTPLRSMPTDETRWAPWPNSLATDSQNHAIAAVVRSQGNAIEVFQGGPSGPSTPLRVITGPLTRLDTCSAGCPTMTLAWSQPTSEIYVAVNSAAGAHVSAFAGGASGNVAPVRTIEGPATGLPGNVVTGLAVSQVTGEIFALIKPSQFGGPAHIAVFAPVAQGNVAPSRTFTDASSSMSDAAGITLISQQVLDVPAAPVTHLAVGPNPVLGVMNVRLILAQPLACLRVDVVDVQGRTVARLWNGSAPVGGLDLRWNARESRAVHSGIYWVRVASKSFVEMRRVAVIR